MKYTHTPTKKLLNKVKKMVFKEIDENTLRLILRRVYVKGQADAHGKTADISWEDKVVEQIKEIFKKGAEMAVR